jgi:hypothetical protein
MYSRERDPVIDGRVGTRGPVPVKQVVCEEFGCDIVFDLDLVWGNPDRGLASPWLALSCLLFLSLFVVRGCF